MTSVRTILDPTSRSASATAAVLFAVGVLLASASPLSSQDVRVGENRQVSSPNPGRAHYELRIAAHPTDPGVLLAAGMARSDSSDEYDILAYRSSDGGETWSRALEVDRGSTVNDPDLAFGPGGRAYMVEMGAGEQLLHRSPDAGRTWLEPISIDAGDRPFLTVSGAGTEHEGRVYIHSSGRSKPLSGERGRPGVTVVRADSGATELLPGETFHVSGDRYVLGSGESAVLSDGTLVLLYPERRDASEIGMYEGMTGPDPRETREPNARLMSLVSRNGGESFGPARPVAEWYHRFGRGRTATVPALAADTSAGPFRDRLYAAWTDFRSGEGQILLSHSEDRGKSWSDPVVVNRGGGPAFRPMLSVNDDGVLGVAWYDRRTSSTGMGYAVRFAASLDGGETVGPSVRVSEEAFRYSWDGGLVTIGRGGRADDRHRADVSLHAFNEMGGHTAGMAADASGRFHPVWVDNRTDVPQMWTAAVEVRGEAVRHGDPELSGLRDVTGRTAVRVESSGYDGAPGVVTVEARLRNTSKDTIRGPLYVRVMDLWSEFGDARLEGPRGGDAGPGAAIPIAGAPDGSGLAPGKTSAPIEIRVRIGSPEDLGPMMPPPPGRRAGGGYGLVNLDLVALGRLESKEEK